MTEFTVYSFAQSPFGRAVVSVLNEKGASYRLVPTYPQDLKREPLDELNPFGRIPVIEHGDFRLYETQAILRYIDRTVPEPALTPEDPRQAARMDQAMAICDWYVFQGVNNVIGFERLAAKRILGRDPDEERIATAIPFGCRVMGILDEFIGDQAYFTGASASLADFMLAPQIDSLRRCPEWAVLTAESPRLVNWLDRIAALESVRRADFS